jgi:hypothetical protein
MAAALELFVGALPGLMTATLSNTFGLRVAEAASPAATGRDRVTVPPQLPIAFAVTQELWSAAAPERATMAATRPRATVARYDDVTVVQAGLFPLVLTLTADPGADVGDVLAALPELLTALEPVRAAAEGFGGS